MKHSGRHSKSRRRSWMYCSPVTPTLRHSARCTRSALRWSTRLWMSRRSCSAFALQERRDIHKRVDQRRAERVHLAECRRVGVTGEQYIHDLLLDLLCLPECFIQLLPSRFRLGLQNAFLCDSRQIPVFQLNGRESSFPVLQGVTETDDARTGQVFPNQFPEVPLPSHKTQDWRGPVRRLGLHKLDQLLAFSRNEFDIRSTTRQP